MEQHFSNEELSEFQTETFVRHFGYVQTAVHNLSDRNGFWPPVKSERDFGNMIALVHSELSEALEANRTVGLAAHDTEHGIDESWAAIELADAIIRIMDMAEGLGLNVGRALIKKHNFNRTRQFKHGKRF